MGTNFVNGWTEGPSMSEHKPRPWVGTKVRLKMGTDLVHGEYNNSSIDGHKLHLRVGTKIIYWWTQTSSTGGHKLRPVVGTNSVHGWSQTTSLDGQNINKGSQKAFYSHFYPADSTFKRVAYE